MKQFFKKLTKTPLTHKMLGYAVGYYAKLCWNTSRKTFVDPHASEGLICDDNAAIFVVWHGRVVLAPFIHKFRSKPHALISQHTDGQLLAYAARVYGMQIVFGSSSRNSTSALKKLIRLARNGEKIYLTPDGPRGPRMRAQAGAVEIARLTKAPIVPVSVSCKHASFLKSWDRLMIPKPFSRISFHLGAPIYVPREADQFEQYRLQLEYQLTELMHAADKVCGNNVQIKPAPV